VACVFEVGGCNNAKTCRETWKLMMNPGNWTTRLLKVKYFSKCDFVELREKADRWCWRLEKGGVFSV